MNTKAGHLWMRLLGLTGISILFAGLVVVLGQSVSQKQPYATWSDFGGALDSMQYSSLKQINKTNVSKLEQVWFYRAQGPRGRFAFSPLIADGVMYVIGEGSAIVALDATTGKQIWSHPFSLRLPSSGLKLRYPAHMAPAIGARQPGTRPPAWCTCARGMDPTRAS